MEKNENGLINQTYKGKQIKDGKSSVCKKVNVRSDWEGFFVRVFKV